MTTETERSRMESRMEFHAKWHAIYKTSDGLDYCREDAPLAVETYSQAVEWAMAQPMDQQARAIVSGFEIERW